MNFPFPLLRYNLSCKSGLFSLTSYPPEVTYKSCKEILEAGWVTVMMGGGPKLMYMQGLLKALEDLS